MPRTPEQDREYQRARRARLKAGLAQSLAHALEESPADAETLSVLISKLPQMQRDQILERMRKR